MLYLLGLSYDSGLFQQVDSNSGPGDLAALGHGEVKVLAEPRRIRVYPRSRVTKGFHYRVNLQNPLLEVPIRCLAEIDQLLQQQISTFSLTRSRLATYDDSLVLTLMKKCLIGSISYGEDVRRVIRPCLTFVPTLFLQVSKSNLSTMRKQANENTSYNYYFTYKASV